MQSQTSDTFPFDNGNDPISYYDPAFSYNKPFSIDSESNSTPKQENNRENIIPSPPPLSFFHFPYSPPFEDPQIFLEQQHDFLLQFHHQPQNPEPQNTMEGSAKKSGEVPRKRSCKRDRHSKINTARGLRDRRMRLSLEVAKRFFGLQDMLGFDKASNTVEWLLNQAKGEINSLAKEKKKQKKKSDDHQSCNSDGSSECEEGMSSLDEVVVNRDQEQQEEERVVKGVKRTRVKNDRKIMSAFHPLAKECRERARERARERTKEKMRSRGILNDESKKCGEEANQDLSQLGSWNPFETGEECGAKNHSVNPSLDVITEANKEQRYHTKEHLGTLEATAHDDDSLVILSNRWSPSLIFNHSGFSHEHLFAEFQSLGKPWEA